MTAPADAPLPKPLPETPEQQAAREWRELTKFASDEYNLIWRGQRIGPQKAIVERIVAHQLNTYVLVRDLEEAVRVLTEKIEAIEDQVRVLRGRKGGKG